VDTSADRLPRPTQEDAEHRRGSVD
jgi:hypothetical protein